MLAIQLRDLAFIAIGVTATVIFKAGTSLYKSYKKDDNVNDFHKNYRP